MIPDANAVVTGVSYPVTIPIDLIDIRHQGAVITVVEDVVPIRIRITVIPHAIFVAVFLTRVRLVSTVVLCARPLIAWKLLVRPPISVTVLPTDLSWTREPWFADAKAARLAFRSFE